MIMIFGAAWSFGANGLPWIISSEIFPASMRSISGPWAAASVWIWTLVVTKALPQMYSSMRWGVYVFFATALVCASVYAWFCIYDTKGLRMDQMDELFGFAKREEAVGVVGVDVGVAAAAPPNAKKMNYGSEHLEKAPDEYTEAV